MVRGRVHGVVVVCEVRVGRVWSSAAVSTEPFPALPSSGKSETRPGTWCAAVREHVT